MPNPLQPPELTPRHLRYFVATAECGSTAAAGRALNVSQPSVSAGILALEAAWGRPLFARHAGRGLQLTAFGRDMLAEARAALAAFAALGMPDGGQSGAGRLTAGFFTTLAPAHMPGVLRHLRLAHPALQVEAAEADLEELETRLLDGILEIALLYDVGLRGGLVLTPVAELRPYALVAADNPLADCAKVSLAELAQFPLVTLDLPLSRDTLLGPFLSRGLSPSIAYVSRSLDVVRGMVAHGHGVTLLYTRAAADCSYDGRPLRALALADDVAPQRLVVAHPRRSPETPLMQAFTEAVRAHLKEAGL
ncbi:LysR family transcriptional regulator [Telmatospirillum sp. J64-1]|uniref:LysR family transcriptional regulator n=1 Tax=Telmatospirillum sp. J64-1 TaxID=2502183 RepID=UPI00115E3185|nr:LysR family transcriptional regulator [Telmatospirillum sp. J64-1]